MNDLKQGKNCIGQDVYDSEGNHGIITDFWTENGSRTKVTIVYDDGTSHSREKYAVKKGTFKKPYKDDIENCLATGNWTYIPGFNNRYIISKDGEIKSAFGVNKGKLLSPSVNKQGYAMIALQTDTGKDNRKLIRVHTLVIESFVRKLQTGEEINHIDGNKTNNKLSNLEITTKESNNKKYLDLKEIGLTQQDIDKIYDICQEKNISLKNLIAKKLKEEASDNATLA